MLMVMLGSLPLLTRSFEIKATSTIESTSKATAKFCINGRGTSLLNNNLYEESAASKALLISSELSILSFIRTIWICCMRNGALFLHQLSK
jgi:hypothetical protein